MSLTRRHSLNGNDPSPANTLLSGPSTLAPKGSDTLQTSTSYPAHQAATGTADDFDIRPVKLNTAQLSAPSQLDLIPSTSGAASVFDQIENNSEPSSSLLTSHTKPSSIGLLDLPLEIRYQIYLHLPDTLVSSRPLIYGISTFKGRKQHCLSSVCHQIRSECLAIFYASNTWLVKLEFDIMYDAFREWITSIGNTNAGNLRLLQISVRSHRFRPPIKGEPAGTAASYPCMDGDATFKVDLSEKFPGGDVSVMRNDGTLESGMEAQQYLANIMQPLWNKRVSGTLAVADWLEAMDTFLLVLAT